MVFKVSVIIPTYNRGDYIRKTIDSVINQTIGFEKIETIVVDDASTDNTPMIIEKYAKKYSNIKAKYLNKNSRYPGKPRNIGIEIASSDYIMFLDSDDYLEKNACEVLYKKISSENADLVCGKSIIHKEGRILNDTPEYFKEKGILNISQKDDEFLKLIELIPPQLPKNIFSKKMINENKIKFIEDIPAQDAPFIIKTYFSAKNIIFLTEFNVYNYIVHDGTITTTPNYNYFKGLFKAEECIINIFKNNNRGDDYKYYLKRRINFFIKQLLSSEIQKNDLSCVFNLFNEFLEKIAIYNIVPKDDLNQLTLYSIKNGDIDEFVNLKNIYSKITRLWNHNEVLKKKYYTSKKKNTRIYQKNNALSEKNTKLHKKNTELKGKYWKLRENNDNYKKRIAELQTVKGWVNFKKSNLINRFEK